MLRAGEAGGHSEQSIMARGEGGESAEQANIEGIARTSSSTGGRRTREPTTPSLAAARGADRTRRGVSGTTRVERCDGEAGTDGGRRGGGMRVVLNYSQTSPFKRFQQFFIDI